MMKSQLTQKIGRGILLAVAVCLSGCIESDSVRSGTDLVAAGKLKTEAVLSDLVDVSAPLVYNDGGVLIVSGTVTRKPGKDDLVPGYLYISFVSPQDGSEVDQLYVSWDPQDIPTGGLRQATYVSRYRGIPPEGYIVRVQHSQKALLAASQGGTGTSYGSNGSSYVVPGQSSFTSTPHTPSAPQQPTTPRTPGIGQSTGRR